MKLVAVILTLDEERHLDRCLRSIKDVVDSMVVVDSYSTDNTVAIADSHGARVIEHPFKTQATQFNWSLTQLDADTEWVLRIDADEYLNDELKCEIARWRDRPDLNIAGVRFARRMTFQGKLIRHGGVFPVHVLRLFRFGKGKCEDRWMDEHIEVDGAVTDFAGELVDDNLQPLTWWIDKHNKYACREVVDLLNLEYAFMPVDSVAILQTGGQAAAKRWLKEKVYSRMPGGFRAFVYFSYRYFVRLGFLDGQAGTAFHVLQGFWYRYLVDAKLAEVKRRMRDSGCPVEVAVKEVLGIEL